MQTSLGEEIVAVAVPPDATTLGQVKRLDHQPALDGLRGVAVILVMLYHQPIGLGPNWFPGGFIGVDLFFVLSGFLITTLLLQEFAATGTIRFRSFLTKRARRLLPAMFVFILLVTAWAVKYAYKPARLVTRDAFAATLGYAQNYWQIFAAQTSSIPVRHTWSLSIEEQFYFVWPVALWLLLRRRTMTPRRLATILLSAATLSAVLMPILYGKHDWVRAYYSTESRAQALLFGAAFAVFTASGTLARIRAAASLTAIATACVALGLWGAKTIHVLDPFNFRGGLSLLAIGSTLVLAGVVRSPTSPLARILAWSPLRAVGRISYGIYLFHVPLYMILSAAHLDLYGWQLVGVRFVATVAFAWCTYRFIEEPLRRGRRLFGIPTLVLLPSAAAVVAGALVLLSVTGAAVPTLTQMEYAWYNRAIHGLPGSSRVLVVGTALINGPATGGNNWFRSPTINTITLQIPTRCGLVDGAPLIGAGGFPEPDCHEREPLLRSATRAASPEIAVMMTGTNDMFDRYINGQRVPIASKQFERLFARRLEATASILAARGARIAATTLPCTNAPESGPFAVFSKILNDPIRVQRMNAIVRTWASKSKFHPIVLDLHRLLCPDGFHRKPGTTNADGLTLTPTGMALLWTWTSAQLQGVQSDPEPPVIES